MFDFILDPKSCTESLSYNYNYETALLKDLHCQQYYDLYQQNLETTL